MGTAKIKDIWSTEGKRKMVLFIISLSPIPFPVLSQIWKHTSAASKSPNASCKGWEDKKKKKRSPRSLPSASSDMCPVSFFLAKPLGEMTVQIQCCFGIDAGSNTWVVFWWSKKKCFWKGICAIPSHVALKFCKA